MVKRFGQLPRPFTPPSPTRGGGFNPERKREKPLTGKVKDLKASQGEERIARVLYKKMQRGQVRDFYFRSSPGIPKGIPGWLELDFEIFALHGNIAISVEGASFVHRGESKKNQDAINELLLMDRLKKLGRAVAKIHKIFDYELTTEEDAEKALKKVGIR